MNDVKTSVLWHIYKEFQKYFEDITAATEIVPEYWYFLVDKKRKIAINIDFVIPTEINLYVTNPDKNYILYVIAYNAITPEIIKDISENIIKHGLQIHS